MGKEIERKFLVNYNNWNLLEKPAGTLLRQGYLLTDPEKTIRVRQAENKGYLTIKGKNIGATRLEYEYEIPVEEAQELLAHFAVSELSKTRYVINFAGKIWEVDEFLGDNAGLIVAEIELGEETEAFEIPEWVAKEVTSEEKYYNSNLTLTPYKNWNI